ncbi:MAG: HD domain-containing protein [Bdellovibrionaceae bacterium]|nr:HD domain-containing protein [Pseudobdellovibrionaceae bacterium]
MKKDSLDLLNARDIRQLLIGYQSRQEKIPQQIVNLLESLADVSDEVRNINQLHHSLQTATMAEAAGASEEIILCALVHDMGKSLSQANHANIAAEIVKPYVSENAYWLIKTHDEFQAYYFNHFFGKDPEIRQKYKGQSWYDLAIQFSQEWDSKAFDQNYKVKPISYFQPLIYQFFSKCPYDNVKLAK